MRDQEDIPVDVSELIRLGTVASVDLAARRCTVLYGAEDDEDGGATTPPIRWLALSCGDTRIAVPPTVGEQAIVLCADGQLAAGIAICGIETDRFPLPVEGAANLILFRDGARIAYDPEAHALIAVLPAGGTALIDAPSGLKIRGNVEVEGTFSASEDVKAGSVSLKDHKHGGVQAGAAQTGGPT